MPIDIVIGAEPFCSNCSRFHSVDTNCWYPNGANGRSLKHNLTSQNEDPFSDVNTFMAIHRLGAPEYYKTPIDVLQGLFLTLEHDYQWIDGKPTFADNDNLLKKSLLLFEKGEKPIWENQANVLTGMYWVENANIANLPDDISPNWLTAALFLLDLIIEQEGAKNNRNEHDNKNFEAAKKLRNTYLKK